ncbi:MAG TPA: DUF4234 domain-containing protein [Planctomycetota bacterium]|nr:DUF4234 domain-containing protein [Planctomycetota bacterium]
MERYPYPRSRGVVSIGIGILLTLLTCGIYGLFWEYRQMATLNAWLGRREFSFWLWIILSILTCGIFAFYYEYKMGRSIAEVQARYGFPVSSDLALISLLLAIFSLGIVSLAVQQYEINKLYDTDADF